VMLIRGIETRSFQLPIDWRTGLDSAARDFVDELLEGRQPAPDVQAAKKVLQIPAGHLRVQPLAPSRSARLGGLKSGGRLRRVSARSVHEPPELREDGGVLLSLPLIDHVAALVTL